MRHLLGPAMVALAAAAFVPATALAAASGPAAKPAAARSSPSPLEGVWVVQPDYYLGKPLKPAPELTTAQIAIDAKRRAARPADYVRTVGNMLCTPRGGPALFVIRSPFEIFQGFGRITFIFETEGSNQPRTVYLGKDHSGDIYPSFNGHSVGHWEGDTLVVDTIGFNGRGELFNGVPKTDKTHVVERLSVSPDGKVMTALITMDDGAVLAKPWTVAIKFDRMASTEERFEVWCEPDLDAFKTVDLEKLKDADPEVARMLDPAERSSDPALKIGPGK
jgi:hypothetical protein